ncbi:MAG: phosphate/phosphite/phosphonate ABC transporter substrate-binding protein [Methylovulum sp.]|uniref:phosphate/phosphite/phosphonate ABC transporter substrate-binding protein n=1 Tax=Methylovulum sp. TaxID=1916980 RepID=UPI002612CC41|nr:phosphate/phosphite/phosphonate ABC transporter substrate-binding protein [Methylovulum sp.]MDD2723058.1 phosphate/phosphite/phosphonate ABC transporter substrate-binding protein [Methylovulum sp.]MDD5123753.1 phosphate/phosphite/phosphonate ABC transporter substrate-binding protein [Methylovulum sp.]
MPYQFTVSPDFSPDHLSGWYIFNTWLQKQLGEAVHLEMYDCFQTQKAVIESNGIDLIYANPFDAAMLVRKKGFRPLARPVGVSDEAIIAVNAESLIYDVADLSSGIKIAVTDDPDIRLMGMIMLEAGDLNLNNTIIISCDAYILVAKQLLKGNADVGVFLAEAYDGLSNIVKSKLRVIVRSEISVIHHGLMIGPKLAHRKMDILELLVGMKNNDKGQDVLKSLGFRAWDKVEDEEMEFMIDLMDALSV